MFELLDGILPRVSKPARYTGGEHNAVHKSIAGGHVRVALAFPDSYEIGMSNLGLRILYHILNGRPDTFAERVFAPWSDMEAEMRRHGLPLFTLETRTPVSRMDILGFSLGYELTYSNVLNMLDLAGLPVLARERTREHPLVIAGGCCTFNPEPMADFIDAFVIGEGEDVVHQFVDTLKAHKQSEKSQVLRELARIDGVYVPSLYKVSYKSDGTIDKIKPTENAAPTIQKRVVANLDEAEYPDKPVVPFIEVIHDRIPLEVMRGCSRGCRFCQAGMIYRPTRERSASRLMELAESLCRNTGYEEISLISLSTADHTEINDLVHALIEKYEPQRIGVSLSSIRADADCVNLASEIRKVRKSGLTLAPEAGTQRLRDVINKNVTEEDLFEAVSAAFRLGWRKVKLYFMIGLPTETDEDIVGIADLARSVVRLARSMGVKPSVTVSVACFVPKPHTPFQWLAQDSLEELERKQELLKRSIRDRNVSLNWHDAGASRIEAALARGDRRLGRAVELAWRSGAVFDAWHETFDYSRWIAAIEKAGLDPGFYAGRQRPYDETLPWDHIDCGVSKEFLMREAERAVSAETTPDCRLPEGKCVDCGVSRLLACPSR